MSTTNDTLTASNKSKQKTNDQYFFFAHVCFSRKSKIKNTAIFISSPVNFKFKTSRSIQNYISSLFFLFPCFIRLTFSMFENFYYFRFFFLWKIYCCDYCKSENIEEKMKRGKMIFVCLAMSLRFFSAAYNRHLRWASVVYMWFNIVNVYF